MHRNLVNVGIASETDSCHFNKGWIWGTLNIADLLPIGLRNKGKSNRACEKVHV